MPFDLVNPKSVYQQYDGLTGDRDRLATVWDLIDLWRVDGKMSRQSINEHEWSTCAM